MYKQVRRNSVNLNLLSLRDIVAGVIENGTGEFVFICSYIGLLKYLRSEVIGAFRFGYSGNDFVGSYLYAYYFYHLNYCCSFPFCCWKSMLSAKCRKIYFNECSGSSLRISESLSVHRILLTVSLDYWELFFSGSDPPLICQLMDDEFIRNNPRNTQQDY
jgi:hypothetical protein